MELLLLGTAAADGWPAPFCDCSVCQGARQRGGPNLRSRSGALIDDDLKIDFCPDTAQQLMRHRRSLGKIQTLIFTHDHPDHLYVGDLKRARPPYSLTRPDAPITVWGPQPVLNQIRAAYRDPDALNLDLHLITPLTPFTTAAGDTILPLPALHCDAAVLFRISRDGRHIFYGHDSGTYPAETIDALSDGVELDVALLDCTNGPRTDTANKAHLNFMVVHEMVALLRQRRAITSRTRVIVTHFSHNQGILHEELLRYFLPHHIEVAYDGMSIVL